MLARQGAAGFEAWTGARAPLEVMIEALEEAIELAARRHGGILRAADLAEVLANLGRTTDAVDQFRRARQLSFTGDFLDADTALAWGLALWPGSTWASAWG